MKMFAGVILGGIFAMGLSAAPAVAAPANDSSTTFSHPLLEVPTDLMAAANESPAPGYSATATETLPAAVDLRQWAPAPGNQGAVNSCVAWSLGYAAGGWWANKQGYAGAPFAPMYPYSQVVNSNVGVWPYQVIDILTAQGIASQSVYTQGNYNWQTKPTTAERADAANHKMLPMDLLFIGPYQGDKARTAISGALASGHPVSLMMYVYSSLSSLNATDYTINEMQDGKKSGQKLLGAHEITAMGYDAEGIIIENSWGTTWGNKGYFKMSWDYAGWDVAMAYQTNGFVAPPKDTAAPTVKTLTASRLNSKTVWGTVSATDNVAVTKYQWSLNYSATNTTSTRNWITTTNSMRSGTLPKGTWYLHVRARDAAGNWSAWKTSGKVTTL